MVRFVLAGSSIAIVTGMLQVEDQRKKTEGFTERFPQDCKGGTVVRVVEGHENEEETFRKCLQLLDELPNLEGLYVNLAIGVPVCHALTARGVAGKLALITSDIFPEMVSYFENRTIAASIYQRPYVQGQTAIRLIVNHVLRSRPLPPTHHVNPAIVLRSNLNLFRETRQLASANAPAVPA
jgi:LacI family transcriptional regulator